MLQQESAKPESVLIPIGQQSCANCMAWIQGPPGRLSFGECRRHAPPPVLLAGTETTLTVTWSTTAAGKWCAEWIPMPIQQKGEKR